MDNNKDSLSIVIGGKVLRVIQIVFWAVMYSFSAACLLQICFFINTSPLDGIALLPFLLAAGIGAFSSVTMWIWHRNSVWWNLASAMPFALMDMFAIAIAVGYLSGFFPYWRT